MRNLVPLTFWLLKPLARPERAGSGPAAMTGKLKQKMGVAVGTAALVGVAYFTAIVMPSMAVPM